MDRNSSKIKTRILLNLVALRKESVDRNRTPHHMNTRPIPSLSARRAWIEISGPLNAACIWVVALRKESVDRNRIIAKEYDWDARRSPQGERG